MHTVAITLLAIVGYLIIWFVTSRHSRRALTTLNDELRIAHRDNAVHLAKIAGLDAELDAAVKFRDFWKESCETWRADAMKQAAARSAMLDRLERQIAPMDDEDAPNPPSVRESDRRAAEARRAHEDVRVAVASSDPRVPPVPYFTEREEDEDEERD